MNISMSLKIVQKHSMHVSSLFTGNIRKTSFTIWLLLRGKCVNQEKLNVKPCPGHVLKGHTKGHTPKWIICTCWPDKHTYPTQYFPLAPIYWITGVKIQVELARRQRKAPSAPHKSPFVLHKRELLEERQRRHLPDEDSLIYPLSRQIDHFPHKTRKIPLKNAQVSRPIFGQSAFRPDFPERVICYQVLQSQADQANHLQDEAGVQKA